MTPAFSLSAAALVLPFAGDAMADSWLRQQALTSSYAFEVQVTRVDDLYQAKAIRVLDRRTGEPVQHMDVGENQIVGEAEKLITLVDANGDGHPDLAMPASEGGSSVVQMNDIYLFDPATRKFRYHKDLSALVNPVYEKDGSIQTSYSRTGFAGGETWRFRGSKLQRIAYGEVTTSVDGRLETSKECRLVRARMRCHMSRRPLPPSA